MPAAIIPLTADELDGVRQQFQQQIDFFRGKLNLPSERWDDIKTRANDKAFYVAGAQKADLLADLRKAVDKSVGGGSIGEFRKDFAEAVRKSGWSGWAGEGTKAGEAWRTRVIYQTNIATSHAAGRWQQLNDPDLVAVRPFWQYIHSDSVITPRPQHKAWGDSRLTLARDHPFWRSHFPPNGWGCQCRIKAVRAPVQGDATLPPEGWDTSDPKTDAPPGIDKGWNYAPGASTDTTLREFVQEKLITYPPAIARALIEDINRYINTQELASAFAIRALADGAKNEAALWLGFLEDAPKISALVGVDVRTYFITLPSDTPRHVRGSHGTDGKGQRPAIPDDYNLIRTILNTADTLKSSTLSDRGNQTIVAIKDIAGERYRAVFEVLAGKKNRALALLSLVIKTNK